jgi:predicted transcriptional regulator
MEDPEIYEPSNSELEILQVLWAHEPATVRFVHEQINLKRAVEVGYTTILKQMQRLADKGVVKRKLKGKTHYYSVVPKQAEVQQNLFQQFLANVYEGSAMKLVMHALGQGKTSPEELEKLEKWVEQQKEQHDE